MTGEEVVGPELTTVWVENWKFHPCPLIFPWDLEPLPSNSRLSLKGPIIFLISLAFLDEKKGLRGKPWSMPRALRLRDWFIPYSIISFKSQAKHWDKKMKRGNMRRSSIDKQELDPLQLEELGPWSGNRMPFCLLSDSPFSGMNEDWGPLRRSLLVES